MTLSRAPSSRAAPNVAMRDGARRENRGRMFKRGRLVLVTKTVMPDSIVILTYKDHRAAAFDRLSRVWLEGHALVEGGDRREPGQPGDWRLGRGAADVTAGMDE